MPREHTQFRVTQNYDWAPWGVAIMMRKVFPDGRVGVITKCDIEVTSRDPDEVVCGATEPKPLLVLDRHDPGLQELMDQLWALGLRPQDIGTAGHLAATQAHLADTKAILNQVLPVVTFAATNAIKHLIAPNNPSPTPPKF